MRMNIEAERARLGLSKEELSRKLGISSKTYSKYVGGSPISSDIRVFQLYGCLGSPEESRPASIFAMILAKGTPKSLVMNLSKVIYDMVPKSVLG